VDVRVAIPCRLIQHDRDATQLHPLAFLVEQIHRLFVELSRVTTPFGPALASLVAGQVGVLTHDEEGGATRDGQEKVDGAKVAIRDPQIPALDQGVHGLQQRPFLGLAVLGQQDVGSGPVLLVQDDQGQAGQGRRPGPA
jgi:hypothetical protein